MFPLYKDKQTVEKMIIRSTSVMKKLKKKYEIVIVDDGCPEQSGQCAKKFSIKNKKIKVIFHKKNLGYGAAIKTGLKNCRYQWIFQTDGDAEYDVRDLIKLVKFTKTADLVILLLNERPIKLRKTTILSFATNTHEHIPAILLFISKHRYQIN